MNSNFPPALVIGDDISALNVIRSLGRKGIRSLILGTNPMGYGASSRYGRFYLCSSLNEEGVVVEKLLDIAREVEFKPVLFCTSDLHVQFVSLNRDVLSKYYQFVLPDHEIIENLMDKRKFYNLATRMNLPVPQTSFSESESTLKKVAAEISYPCVIKPLYRTKYWSQNVPYDKKVMKVSSPKELMLMVDSIKAANEPLIIQEWVPGGDDAIFFCLAYIDRLGKVLASCTGRKLRQYPSLTGVTSLAESIQNQELRDLATSVLISGGCRGLCSVEFKRDTQNGAFKITEPTVGRVDLQEGLSTQAGIDLPYIAYLDALGKSYSVQDQSKNIVKWINEPFEVNSLITQVKADRKSLGSFFHLYRGKKSFALLCRDDPRPFLQLLWWIGKRALRFIRKSQRPA